ncbi:amidohydrolase family protein [Vicingus serpentipes]|uniref:Amidohydrolase family protein n=1 Tax=Vicingus serpentipes TaxID=1926625 RepID=A0A5C6RS28_9FLAO|nr:amidohydrolase family protein [Vicingus serpentipes]TXB64839.1 amidohydrolase family protein [Vicingus serpentipes]
MKNIFLILLIGAFFGAKAQVETPASPQTKSILLMNGFAHLGNGKVIENAAIGIKDGKLTLVADARVIKLEQNAYDTVINIQGKHVYPGIIAPNSTLGLVEIDAVRATDDQREAGTYTPHVRSIIAYNTESKITTTVRSNGVLMGQITPRGNYISGTSSIVQFDAWNWEDAVYKEDDGVHLNWYAMFNRWNGKANKNYGERVEELKEFFANAQAYSKENNYEEINLRFEAMRGVFSGEQTLFIHANFVKEITEAIDFGKKFDIKKMVIVGGYDAWRVSDMLKDNNVAVILRRVHELPIHEDDDVYLPYKLPKLLFDAGVLFCLENSGDMETMGTRNLPFYAGTAAAYGIEKEEALKLITLNTAKILGIDSTTGSLESGKDATLFISTGDALDVRTNNVIAAFIQGRLIDVDNHQKKLYRKYSEKYKN